MEAAAGGGSYGGSYPSLFGFTATVPGNRREAWESNTALLSREFANAGGEGNNIHVMLREGAEVGEVKAEVVKVPAREDDVSVLRALGHLLSWGAGGGLEGGTHGIGRV